MINDRKSVYRLLEVGIMSLNKWCFVVKKQVENHYNIDTLKV